MNEYVRPLLPAVSVAGELGALLVRLADLSTDAGDAELVERIAVLERVKAAAAAAQARMTAAFAVSQRAAQQAAGVPAKGWDRGISAQIALAKRESPARAARYTGWAKVLVNELPRTFTALACGETTEWRAMVVARETIWLSRADRATVDEALAGRLPTLGDHQVECEAKKLAYRLDPEGFIARSRAAASGRRVSLRPAPDTMTRLTALLPAAQGAAAYGALVRAASAARAAGDPRGQGQVMADTLVERVTGQSAADDVPVTINLVMTDHTLFGDFTYAGRHSDALPDSAATGGSSTHDGGSCRGAHADRDSEFDARKPSDANDQYDTRPNPADHVDRDDSDDHGEHGPEDVGYPGADGRATSRSNRRISEPSSGDRGRSEYFGSSDRVTGGRPRFGESGRDEPAHLVGYGPIPAGIARDLARVKGARAWLRRLYAHPRTGDLAAMESRARIFPERIRHAMVMRDQLCRTPWCGAPIRHADHARSIAEGGETSLANGQGLCEACNYAKQSSGWRSEPSPNGAGESVTITTPTGHRYVNGPPALPGSLRRGGAMDRSPAPREAYAEPAANLRAADVRAADRPTAAVRAADVRAA